VDVTGIGERRDKAQTTAFRVIRIADFICEGLAHAGMLMISLFVVLQLAEIGGREVGGFSILGLSEIGQVLVMGCICLTLPLVFVRDGHIAVEFLTDRLPAKALDALKSIIGLLAAVFVGALTYYAYGQAQLQIAKGDFSPTLHIPIIWYWTPLLLGIVCSGAASLVQAIRYALAVALGGSLDTAKNSQIRYD
jgi:TRAP-type C4-dicarboxylate transport system permease small subunit